MIDVKTKLCCVIGNPVEQSLSPQLHNAVYDALGLNYAFLAFKVTDIKKALDGLRTIGVCGISVTIPHKLEVLKYVDEVDKEAQVIGAVNTIVNDCGRLIAFNTDWRGALQALEEKTTLANKRIALLGAGGTARALAFGLTRKKAKISIFNRTIEKAYQLVKDFNLEGAFPISDVGKIKSADIIINTTPIGMVPDTNQSPIPVDCINSSQIVFEVVYKPKETKLIQYTKAKKATVVYGYKMLLYQAQEQFKLFTGIDAPIEMMEKALKND